MTESSPNPPAMNEAAAPLWPLVVGLCLATVGAYFAGGYAGERLTPDAAGLERGAAWGAGSVGLAALIGLLCVLPPGVRSPGRLGTGVLIASGARLVFLLATSVAVFALVKPAGASLFSGVAAGGALCLFFETAWATRFLKRAFRARSGALLA